MNDDYSNTATLEASPARDGRRHAEPRTVVVDMGGKLAAQFAEHSGAVRLKVNDFLRADDLVGSSRIVVFLSERLVHVDDVATKLVRLANRAVDVRVVVASSFRAHFGATNFLAAEQSLIGRLLEVESTHVTVLRPGNVLEKDSRPVGPLRRLAKWYPLVPSGLRSTFLDKQELFAAIDAFLSAEAVPRRRVLALLGRNRHLREVLAECVRPGQTTKYVVFVARLLACLGFARVLGLAFRIAARFRPALRCWRFDTLTPTSTAELLSLVNPFNYAHLAVAGYNTGVIHFGWKWPGRTVVKTVGSGQVIRLRGKSVVVDAGATLKQTAAALARVGRELCVMPNYSYISMGTPFFVPVHGSACECSTLGETIEKVWLYDARIDRVTILRRGEAEFAERMYRPLPGVLALRLEYRVQPRRRFVVETSKLHSPTADDVWRLFVDSDAANIELRKSRANSSELDVFKYYPANAAEVATVEVARDSVGRLWDRLEENALTSFLFHTLVRRCGFHVELFLDEQEFAVFWRDHGRLPLSKIQLRFVRADHLPHSPCGSRDCISADLFMPRWKSAAFLHYLREQIPDARFNPGKHSL